jgi:hypothetical protein
MNLMFGGEPSGYSNTKTSQNPFLVTPIKPLACIGYLVRSPKRESNTPHFEERRSAVDRAVSDYRTEDRSKVWRI